MPCRCVSRLFSTSDARPSRRRVADRLCRLERETAGEDREPREQRLLVQIEQAEAPVDRGAQRPVALRGVARTAGQDRQPLVEPLQQLRRGKQLHARGGELDRERQVVETRADLRDDGAVAVQDEVGPDRARPLGEELDRGVARKRRHGVLLLAREPEGYPARRENLRVRRGSKPAAERRARLDDALDVVEDQQDAPCRAR